MVGAIFVILSEAKSLDKYSEILRFYTNDKPSFCHLFPLPPLSFVPQAKQTH